MTDAKPDLLRQLAERLRQSILGDYQSWRETPKVLETIAGELDQLSAERDALLKGDEIRVRDISRLTIERDDAREQVDALKAEVQALREVLTQRVVPVLDWLESYPDTAGASAVKQLRGYVKAALEGGG